MTHIKLFDSFTEMLADELKKTERTYLKRRFHEDVQDTEKYHMILRSLKNYDISNFRYNNKPYDFYIIPDNNYIEKIKKLNDDLEIKIPTDLKFEFSYDTENLNLIDFKKGIPDLLRGVGLGYNLYLFIIKKVGFITTNKYSSTMAIHIWRNLITNKELYAFTSNDITGVIVKNQSNDEIKSYLDKLKNYNSNVLKFNFDELVFDEELEEKIIEIYGSLDIYKQRN